jgi:hypothetical protein
MPTLVLTSAADPSRVSARRVRVHERLLARWRAFALDRALADGVSPDSSAVLSLRAERLISRATRADLARSIRHLIADAQAEADGPSPLGDPHVRACSRAVRRVADQLELLARRLLDPDPVDAAGVARLDLLLRDGAGPLYCPSRSGEDLPELLYRVGDALEVSLQPTWPGE